MVALRETDSPLAENGIYLVAETDGTVRALVDPSIGAVVPRLPVVAERIGRVLRRCLAGEDVAVRIIFERGPSRHGAAARRLAAGVPA